MNHIYVLTAVSSGQLKSIPVQIANQLMKGVTMAARKLKVRINGVEASIPADWVSVSSIMEVLLSAADDERRRGHLANHEKLMRERTNIFEQAKGMGV